MEHEWKDIYEEYKTRFLGTDCIDQYLRFRICKKCGLVQEYFLEDEPRTLSPSKKAIFEAELIKPNLLIDKGDYYVIPYSVSKKYQEEGLTE